MTSHYPADRGPDRLPPPWADGPLSLEERLLAVRERCRLLAYVFSLQAEATLLACHVSMSADAYNALTDMCRSSADDLERLAHDIPGAIANWCPAPDAGLGGGMGLAADVASDRWERCKNPVDGDGRP